MTDLNERDVWDRHFPRIVSREEVDEWFRKRHEKLNKEWNKLYKKWERQEKQLRRKEKKLSYQKQQQKIQQYLEYIIEKHEKCNESDPLVSTALRLGKFDPETIWDMHLPPNPIAEQARRDFDAYKKSMIAEWQMLMKKHSRFFKKITKRKEARSIKKKVKQKKCEEITDREIAIMEYYTRFFVVYERNLTKR